MFNKGRKVARKGEPPSTIPCRKDATFANFDFLEVPDISIILKVSNKTHSRYATWIASTTIDSMSENGSKIVRFSKNFPMKVYFIGYPLT